MFSGEMGYDLEMTGGAVSARAYAGIRWSGALVARDVVFDAPLARLHRSPGVSGWSGQVNARFPAVRLESRWPVEIEGTIALTDFRRPDSAANLGSYTVTFQTDPGSRSPHGTLQDAGGPLAVSGDLTLRPDKTYELTGFVTARPGAPEELKDAFAFLGPPDQAGRRAFQIAGSL
jgi:hypothetical protein